jgi:hypothetical protein
MARDFKAGDHVSRNSEVGRIRGTVQERSRLRRIHNLHGPRLEGRAPISGKERQDRPFGHAERNGVDEDREKPGRIPQRERKLKGKMTE